jgi:hypothetical protein
MISPSKGKAEPMPEVFEVRAEQAGSRWRVTVPGRDLPIIVDRRDDVEYEARRALAVLHDVAAPGLTLRIVWVR